ncbi:hypothetical protein ACS0TY_019124 [Phlomoides rotata]
MDPSSLYGKAILQSKSGLGGTFQHVWGHNLWHTPSPPKLSNSYSCFKSDSPAFNLPFQSIPSY